MIGNLAVSLLLAATSSVAASSEPVQPTPFPDQGEPITDVAYTEDLEAHYRNGRLPSDILVELESSPGCFVEREAAEAWLRLEVLAAADGVEFTASWCYRNMKTQRRTYRRNCPLVTIVMDPPEQPVETPAEPDESPPTPDPVEVPSPDDQSGEADPDDGQDPTDPADGESPPEEPDPESTENPSDPDPEVAQPESPPVKRFRACRVPTARPGNSNHGWGRAIDITQDGTLLTCESPAFLWLVDNASRFGWVHPGWAACGEPKEEAWHWEWGATVYEAKTLQQVGLVVE